MRVLYEVYLQDINVYKLFYIIINLLVIYDNNIVHQMHYYTYIYKRNDCHYSIL